MKLRHMLLTLAVIGMVLSASAQQTDCEQAAGFKFCPSDNQDAVGRITFSDKTAIDVYRDRLFFRDTGSSYRFDEHGNESAARDAATSCLATPVSFYKRVGNVPANWQMNSATDYLGCMSALQTSLRDTTSLMKRHRDLSERLYSNMAYTTAVVDYLLQHFGEARFDVYTLSQKEEAYKALHKKKWD